METDIKVLNDDLTELKELEGLSIWAEHQSIIEQQALEHLNNLVSEANNKRNVEESTDIPIKEVEDGELSEVESDVKNSSTNKILPAFLDVQQYIKSQENLRSISKPKKELDISETSLLVAKRLSEKQRNKINKSKSDKVKNKINETSKKINLKADKIDKNDNEQDEKSGSEYVPSENELDDEEYTRKPRKKKLINENVESGPSKVVYSKIKDDGNLSDYKTRISSYKDINNPEYLLEDEDFDEEEQISDKILEHGLKVPGCVWRKLYRYQKVGVKWMWELNKYKVGGLLGDEMGLGKTVQVIAYFAALDYSKLVSKYGCYKGLGPTLIVCPATVLYQWVSHFHNWWPRLRVAVLHQSGNYNGNKIQLIKEINRANGVLLTTYQSVLRYKGVLTELQWHYIVLDEGHKIRNPTAKITVAVKLFRTPHRLVLTGSPMQNNLTELWSLFDFITPGKLGSLQVFQDHFATPIVHGGYANATPMQEATALSIATALKNTITPYMLRRQKANTIELPDKNEQVLFCSLTLEQRDLYKGYLMAEHVSSILDRGRSNRRSDNMMRAKMLMALTTLRKICNHPDLYLGEMDALPGDSSREIPVEQQYGYFKRSGKMVVVAALLRIWKRQGHRILLFTQGKMMIEIFETFLLQHEYKYLKMDGTTNIGSRQTLIEKFNNDESYFVFLLTTRVGGLGINLTGANRVVIFDPDWNPATDTQARERAWRIGQEKEVTIYRLLCAGTIEEKIYQRQVWKQLLSNKVLSDPKQQRFFKTSDLHELFSLQEPTRDGNTETGNIFQSSRIDVIPESKKTPNFSDEKILEMKSLAQKLAKNMTVTPSNATEVGKSNVEQVKSEEKPDAIYILDPGTVRFKYRRKIEIPVEKPDQNLINNKETTLTFTDILDKIDKQEDLINIDNEGIKSEENTKIQAVQIKHKKRGDKNTSEIEVKQEDTFERKKHKKRKREEKAEVNILEKDEKKHKKRKKDANIVDGEEIEGLVKKEKTKPKKTVECLENKQDDFILQKLFSKGVHAALKHDVIMQSGYEDKNSIRVKTEAQRRTECALEALRKSRSKR